MSKENLFKKPSDIEKDKKEKLLKEGGIYYFEKEDPETGETKQYVNIMGVEVETEASSADIEKIIEKIVMSDIDQKLLRQMAETYVLRQPLILEGPPAVGKTFLSKYFTKLLYGAEALPLTIYGTTKTDAEDIVGHWVPKVVNEAEKKLWNDYLDSIEGKKTLDKITADLEKKKNLSAEQKQNIIQAKLAKIAKSIGLVSLSEFEFRLGPLLKAYAGNDGNGYILDVEEIGVMPTNIQETFLPIGGDSGKLADVIQFWGNGKEIYHRGDKTWVIFNSNPPEKVGGRHEITTPMASRLTWIRIPPKAAVVKVEAITDYLYAGERGEIKVENIFIPVEKPIDFRQYPGMVSVLAKASKIFHTAFSSWYNNIGEPDRNQKFELGAREVARVLANILKFQYRGEDGQIDLTIGLRKAINMYYIDRLADSKGKKLMNQLLDSIIGGDGNNELLKSVETKIDGMSVKDRLKQEMENLNPEMRITKQINEIEKNKQALEKEFSLYNNSKITKAQPAIKEINKKKNELIVLENQAMEESDLNKKVEMLEDIINQYKDLYKKDIGKLKEIIVNYKGANDNLEDLFGDI